MLQFYDILEKKTTMMTVKRPAVARVQTEGGTSRCTGEF